MKASLVAWALDWRRFALAPFDERLSPVYDKGQRLSGFWDFVRGDGFEPAETPIKEVRSTANSGPTEGD